MVALDSPALLALFWCSVGCAIVLLISRRWHDKRKRNGGHVE